MIVPADQIEPETLRNLAESFVLREGTDYGREEVPFEQKVEDVITQLKNGSVLIEYSELHESVDLISREALELRQRNEKNSRY